MNTYEASKAQKASIARYVALALVLVNAALTLLGFPVLPEGSGEVISAAAVLFVGLYVGFKNNYLTKHGKAQAEVLARSKMLKK